MKTGCGVARLRLIFLVGPIFALAVVGPCLPAFAQTTDQLLHSYLGQKFILRGFGNKSRVNINAKNPSMRGGRCDTAVEVKEAVFKGDKLRFRLEHIGDPTIPNRKTRPCNSARPDETVLTISGIWNQQLAAHFSGLLDQIIQTPEAYLESNGVRWRSQPAQRNAPVVELTNSSETPPGITRARPVLIVNASYSEHARRQQIQGVVSVAIDVGTNGVIQSAHVVKGVDASLDRQVLRVLPLFRFEPGMKDGQVVIVRTNLDMSFQLF